MSSSTRSYLVKSRPETVSTRLHRTCWQGGQDESDESLRHGRLDGQPEFGNGSHSGSGKNNPGVLRNYNRKVEKR